MKLQLHSPHMKSSVIPENILKCMSPEDRRKHGQKTAAEVLAQGEAKSEKELQKQIVALLRLKGVEVNVSRMDKRKTDVVGWPDLTFCVYAMAPQMVFAGLSEALPKAWQVFPCLWEIKMPKGELTPEQQKIGIRLISMPNGWRHRVIRSVDQALAELREMGIQ